MEYLRDYLRRISRGSTLLRTRESRAAVTVGLLLSFMMLPVLVGSIAAAAGMRVDKLWIVTASGEQAVDVEMAETGEQKALGLMFRRSLAPNTGMLFPYGRPQEITMWMRNTYISLDMVFIRRDGAIHRIEANTEPQSDTIIPSKGEVSAVLELAAGEAARLGIKPGDKIRHPEFGTAR